MSEATISPASAGPEKKAVALNSAAAALLMTLLKLATGLATGSLGVLSDAAHSGIDLLGAGLTYLSVRMSGKPADEDHPYGHAKVENLSAFFETILMLSSAIWISYEAISRMLRHDVSIRYSAWPLAVLALSMGTDYWRSHQLAGVAKRTHSDALAADALHFASDIWASAAVFLGLSLSWIGARAHLSSLRYADSITALLVSVLILRMCLTLARRTVGALLDSIPIEMRSRVLAEVQRVDGVLGVDQARMRRAGASYFADLTLSLSRQLTFQHAEQLVEEATAAVHRILPDADVVIRTVARETSTESIFDRVRAVALRNNVVLHDVAVQRFGTKLAIEQHIEVNESLPLREAHRFVRRIEDEIRQDVPQVDRVVTHIESEPGTIEQPVSRARDRAMEDHLRRAAATLPKILDVHDVVVSSVGDRFLLSCHVTMPDNLPMQQVHEVITTLESRFKSDCPEVSRVVIHPEPETDNHHH
ncbi:MAG TPA: cation diffusion facilitator family transporter [Acidobacteriaceae bacterium]